MSMHMLGPAWTTTGKKKGKQKFKSAAHAAKAKANAESWKKLLEKYDVKPTKKSNTSSFCSKSTVHDYRRTELDDASSLDSGSGVAVKKNAQMYTGDECIGIAVMHKSCLQPIFNRQSAEDVAKMRRG
jgi:hypothetical protein